MEEKINTIKKWLGTGSINIFGLPMSGKDTVGIRLAELIDARFLSSGMIIRAAENETNKKMTANGELIPTNIFYDLVLPYFEREDLKDFPLILSSIGRWYGEEKEVLKVAEGAGHPIKAAVILDVSEDDIARRWETAKVLGDRGMREDDKDPDVFRKRITDFRTKTLPVLKTYKDLGLLVNVRADMTRDEVFNALVEKLYLLAKNSITN